MKPTKHILCIEDEAPIRDMLRFSLEREGFTMHEAENSLQMQEQISKQRPDLILMDWMLPDTSGPHSSSNNSATTHSPATSPSSCSLPKLMNKI